MQGKQNIPVIASYKCMGPQKIAPANVSQSPPPNKTPDETSIDDDAKDRWEHSTEVKNEAQLGVDNVSPPNSEDNVEDRNEKEEGGSGGEVDLVEEGDSPQQQRRNSIVEMLKSATAVETLLSVLGKGKIKKNDMVRILVSSFEPKIIDSKDTVAATLFGPKMAKYMWALLKGPSAIIANIFFFICCIIVCACHWLPNSYSYITILSLVYLIPNVCSMNCYIVKRILRSFDFYLYSGYLTATIITIITSLRDARIVAFMCGWIFGIYLLFCDALPEKVRIKTLRFGVILYAVAMFLVCLFLWLGIIRDLHEWDIKFGKTTYSSSVIAMNCGGNFLLFNSKSIFHAIKTPHRFSLIGAKLKSIKGNARHVGAFKHFNNLISAGNGTTLSPKTLKLKRKLEGSDGTESWSG
ncbi:hypothetical protein TL16_g08073 [Triparma laevis f. inornata]|uniref:Uncharacterized protein n=1 Tax=Triparma laevis f. inornata TaxID=1714386 RepID=A0A9W7AUB9_9STRA|nr:hypothetical protein TL16_g08073 [Triparma laevis f. inornata]